MKRYVFLLLVGAAACTEQATAPGLCPDFCPGGEIEIADTIFTDVIERDSAFRGYFQPYEAEAMTVAEFPTVVDSRAIFLLNGGVSPERVVNATDTVAITVDSARLRLIIVRRDTGSVNLRLKIYRLPLSIDSSTTFAALDSDTGFNTPPVDSVNFSDLLDRPILDDTATLRRWGAPIRTDSAGHVLQVAADSSLILFFDFNTTQAPFVPADSGRLAYGVRVSADSMATLAIGANDICNCDPQIRWFYHYPVPDTLPATPDSIAFEEASRETIFDSFVFDPPNLPIDDNLTIGGAPSARSLVRVAFPSFLRDSFDIVRATVVLVPVSPVPAFAGDSFRILARPILTDVGAKSPLSVQGALFGRASLAAGSTDTVRLELSDLVRLWARDTSVVTAFAMGSIPEAASSVEVRFYSSRSAFRPALHVTYVKRFPFGTP